MKTTFKSIPPPADPRYPEANKVFLAGADNLGASYAERPLEIPPAAGQAAHTPEYSERGPVWRVVPMESLPEMATKTVIIWLVVDLDYNERDHTGYEMARCAKKSDAEFLARACNSHAALVAALELIIEFYDGEHGEPGIVGCQAIEDARSALKSALP